MTTTRISHAGLGAVTAALAALVLAACSGEDPKDGPAAAGGGAGARTAEDKAFDGALRFSRCMRGEGLDFPDPEKTGKGLIKMGGPGAKIDPDDPKVKAAQEKCGKHLARGGGEKLDPATKAKHQDAFVRYARCMRRNGVDMPDPEPGGGFTMRAGEPGAVNPESSAFRAADEKCHALLAEVDRALDGERSG